MSGIDFIVWDIFWISILKIGVGIWNLILGFI